MIDDEYLRPDDYQVIASATVFFKRFYAMNTLNCVDPLLLAPTCVFLSSKVLVL